VYITFDVVWDLIKRTPVLTFCYKNVIIEWLYCVWYVKSSYKSWNFNEIKIVTIFFLFVLL